MSDYPDYFPPFLRDFHDFKRVVKAFYTWLDLLDTRQEIENHRKYDGLHPRRAQTCDWISFNVLVVSFLDFMFRYGYQLQKTHRPGDYAPTEEIDALGQFNEMYWSVVHPEDRLSWRPEHTAEMMTRAAAMLPYMPTEVQEAWRTFADHLPPPEPKP